MRCPICKKNFKKKGFLSSHILEYHPEAIPPTMNIDQFIYYHNYGRLTSKCMCGCGKDTKWNYNTGKPSRLTDDPECKERVRAIALKNGSDGSMLRDMNHQRKMQENRKISKIYKFKDGSTMHTLSTYEYSFLSFCENMCDMTSNMIMNAYQIIKYKDGNEHREYMPDFYLPDYNLLVEIKASNTNPEYQKTTGYKVKLKDDAMKKQKKYNYIRINDNKFGPFLEIIFNIRQNRLKYDNSDNMPIIISLSENAEYIPAMARINLYMHNDVFAYVEVGDLRGYYKISDGGRICNVDLPALYDFEIYECIAEQDIQDKFISYLLTNDVFPKEANGTIFSIISLLELYGIKCPKSYPSECDFIFKQKGGW